MHAAGQQEVEGEGDVLGVPAARHIHVVLSVHPQGVDLKGSVKKIKKTERNKNNMIHRSIDILERKGVLGEEERNWTNEKCIEGDAGARGGAGERGERESSREGSRARKMMFLRGDYSSIYVLCLHNH